jgi:amino-acid N-acetyltransferase
MTVLFLAAHYYKPLKMNPSAQGTGDGERLLHHILQRAKKLGLKKIFVLTTRTMHWFLKRGFKLGTPEMLPAERRKSYNYARKSQVLIKTL